MNGFHDCLDELLGKSDPSSVHEVGCGKGYWTIQCQQKGLVIKGSDFSEQIINTAEENANAQAFRLSYSGSKAS